MSSDLPKLLDLGLPYEVAVHGVQSAIDVAMNTYPDYRATEEKHMRVGVDMSKADMCGLANLMIRKGLITLDEYMEAMRLGANHELAMREIEHYERTGVKVSFR